MRKYSHEYVIAKYSDEKLFDRQCAALEKNIPKIEKGIKLYDVDDSIIQLYKVGANEIRVDNDTVVGVILVQSDIDLLEYFTN